MSNFDTVTATATEAAESALFDKYDHYQQLVMKALVKRGGSTSETIVYKFLTSDVTLFKDTDNITEMWRYLDEGAKRAVIEYANIAWLGAFIMTNAEFIERLEQRMTRIRQNQLFNAIEDKEPGRYRNDDEDELYDADERKCYQQATKEVSPLFK